MLCLLRLRRPPRSTLTYTLFPYTTLVRSGVARAHLRRGFEHDHSIARGVPERLDRAAHPQRRDDRVERFGIGPPGGEREFVAVARARHREPARLERAKAHDIARRIGGDRKSTRLNSSH